MDIKTIIDEVKKINKKFDTEYKNLEIIMDILEEIEPVVEKLINNTKTFQIKREDGLIYLINKNFINTKYRLTCFCNNIASSHSNFDEKKEFIEAIINILPVNKKFDIEYIN